jgi:hypothetical protein
MGGDLNSGKTGPVKTGTVVRSGTRLCRVYRQLLAFTGKTPQARRFGAERGSCAAVAA